MIKKWTTRLWKWNGTAECLKNLVNLQGIYRNNSFSNFYVEYNGFCLKKMDQYNRRGTRSFTRRVGTHSFTPAAVIFFEILTCILTHFGKNSTSSLTFVNFWKAERALYPRKNVILLKIDCSDRKLLLHVFREGIALLHKTCRRFSLQFLAILKIQIY